MDFIKYPAGNSSLTENTANIKGGIMGCYIDPINETKEEFLEREGEEVVSDVISMLFKEFKKGGKLPVVWVDNGRFTAAGIAYCESEFERFVRYDNRPKKFYLVDIEKLKDVSDVEAYLREFKEEEWRKHHN